MPPMIHPILEFLQTAPVHPPFDMLERYEQGKASQQECLLMAEYLKNTNLIDRPNYTDQKLPDNEARKTLQKLNNLLKKKTNLKKILLGYRHDIQPYQIWSTRSRQYSVFAESIHTFYPYMVMIKSAPQTFLGNHGIVRVQPISFIMEFMSEGDIIINGTEPLGMPFIIETWNEQPMLKSGLYQFIFKLNLPLPEPYYPTVLNGNDRKLISQFRYFEIQNTGYLRQPVMSLFKYYENNIHEGCVIHDGNKPYLIGPTIPEKQTADGYVAMAAKTGSAYQKMQTLGWTGILGNIPCELTITIFENEFDLMLRSEKGKLQLFDESLIPLSIARIQKRDSIMYQKVNPGIYFIGTKFQVGLEHLTLRLSPKPVIGE